MEDVQIIQNTQYSIYQQEQQPTKAQEQQAKLDFETRMAAAASRIGGTGITDEQKMAIIKLCVQPSTNWFFNPMGMPGTYSYRESLLLVPYDNDCNPGEAVF